MAVTIVAATAALARGVLERVQHQKERMATITRRAFVTALAMLSVPLVSFAQNGDKKKEAEKEKEKRKEEAKKNKDEAKDKARDAADDHDKVVDGPGSDRSQDRRQDRRRDAAKK